MRRILSVSIAVVLVLLVCGVVLATIALRDNRAREATGQQRFADSGGVAIAYLLREPAEGSEARSVIALLPSYARSASDFNELVPALNAAGHRTIAMQPRGVEGSELPSFDTTLDTYAEDLLAVLDAEDVTEPVVVIGHAYGNRIARTFSQRHPDRVDALILLAAGGEEPPSARSSAAIGKSMLGIHPEHVRRRAIHEAFFARANPVPGSWMRGWYPLAGLAQGRATAATPYASWEDGGVAPILVLEPDEDAVAAGAGERLRSRFPNRVRLEVIEGAGHALLPEQPEHVMRSILDYLSERAAQREAPPL